MLDCTSKTRHWNWGSILELYALSLFLPWRCLVGLWPCRCVTTNKTNRWDLRQWEKMNRGKKWGNLRLRALVDENPVAVSFDASVSIEATCKISTPNQQLDRKQETMKFQPLHIAVIASFLLSCNEAFTPSFAVTSTRPTMVAAVRNSKHTDPRSEHVVGMIHKHWKDLLLYTATAVAFTVTPIQPVSASPTFNDFDRCKWRYDGITDSYTFLFFLFKYLLFNFTFLKKYQQYRSRTL